MRFAMSSSPHIRCGDNTRRIMLDVLIALLPTLLAGTIFFGLRCLLLAAVSIAAAGLAEALWNKLTGRYQTVEDLSAAVTGLLLALTLPGHRALLDGGGGCGVCRHCSEGCLRWPGPEHFQSPRWRPAPCCCCCFPRP